MDPYCKVLPKNCSHHFHFLVSHGRLCAWSKRRWCRKRRHIEYQTHPSASGPVSLPCQRLPRVGPGWCGDPLTIGRQSSDEPSAAVRHPLHPLVFPHIQLQQQLVNAQQSYYPTGHLRKTEGKKVKHGCFIWFIWHYDGSRPKKTETLKDNCCTPKNTLCMFSGLRLFKTDMILWIR